MDLATFMHRESRQHESDSFSSARLRYVKFNANDERAVSYTHKCLNDPVYAGLDNLKYTRPVALDEIQTFVQERNKALLVVAICLPPTDEHPDGEIIGEMGLGDELTRKMFASRRAMLGIGITKEHQGKGYGREAINWLLDWGFSQVGLHTIALKVNSFNEAAIRLYKGVGFVEEGREREVRYMNRKWYDVVLFSMTEGEWEQLRGDTQ